MAPFNDQRVEFHCYHLVLNAELKSTNSTRTLRFWLFEVFENEMYESVVVIVCVTFILVHELKWNKYIFNVIRHFSSHKQQQTNRKHQQQLQNKSD